MYLWSPAETGAKSLARMQGHQKAINHVAFSPDGTLIASARWDNSSKLWSARSVLGPVAAARLPRVKSSPLTRNLVSHARAQQGRQVHQHVAGTCCASESRLIGLLAANLPALIVAQRLLTQA